MGNVSYASREDVVVALGDSSPDARTTTVIDRAIDSGSRSVEALCHRVFYPWSGTRSFSRARDWEYSDRLWLDQNELISVSGVDVAGATVDASNWQLMPGDGPPYTSIYLPNGPSLPVQGLSVVTGVFGYGMDYSPAGMAAGTWDDAASALSVTNGAVVGVGDLLMIDDERLLVTGRTWADTGDTLQAPLTGSNADTGLAVSSGPAFHVGEQLLLDAERVLVTDVAGDTLIVKRAVAGTVLASHTGSTVYASRTLMVERGATGTTAASHLTGANLVVHRAPGLVRALALAEACNEVASLAGGYQASSGSGEGTVRLGGAGLNDLRARVYAGFGRKARMRSI